MALTAGIVGLPNVGKSTLFNAITKAGALAANYPFATIEPNVGMVEVPDDRLWVLSDMYKPKKVLCFATKEDWWNPSKLVWIERGLEMFSQAYKGLGITSIAFPKLGCTNGKLNWENDVKPLMFKYLQPLDIICEIYE